MTDLRWLTYAQSRVDETDEDSPENDPGPQRQRHAGHQLSVGRRNIGGYGLAMGRVMKNNSRDEKRHFDQERPIEIVHVGIRREQQQSREEHEHQAAKCPKPGVLGELRGSLAAHADAQERKIHNGDGAYRQRKSDNVEALKSWKDIGGRIKRIRDQHWDPSAPFGTAISLSEPLGKSSPGGVTLRSLTGE